jgi:hypothetical protein
LLTGRAVFGVAAICGELTQDWLLPPLINIIVHSSASKDGKNAKTNRRIKPMDGNEVLGPEAMLLK